MKEVKGWFLPDNDQHFEAHLNAGPIVYGRTTYQYRKIEAALNCIPPKSRRLAVDVGAHVGFWTFFLAKAFRNVLAFEPVDELYECWAANILVPNAKLVRAAVSDREKQLPMMRPNDNSGNWSVSIDEGQAVMMVPAISLDSLNLSNLDFLKVDVEGWEDRVIRGAEGVIRGLKPVIVVEQKPGHGTRYGTTDTAAFDLLRSWGMKLLWLKSGDYCLGW
jgi:FkbM family methyltransferase